MFKLMKRLDAPDTLPPQRSSTGSGRYRRALQLLLLSLGLHAAPGLCAPVQSAGKLTFVDANTMVVADWRGGQLHALTLPAVAPGAPGAFNLKDVSAAIARTLHTSPEKLRFQDMAVRPGSEVAYIALSVEGRTAGAAPIPALVSVNAAGQVGVVNLGQAARKSVAIGNLPSPDKHLWRETPAASFTVTDMKYHDGKLYVAGLSNASFASTLRVFDFPFQGQAAVSSIEMYHPVHNQVETRAPIRKMVITELNGEPTLVAAFTCSPLVTIPLKDLKDGAHLAAKTVAEFGWGSAPVGMVMFDAGQGPMVLLTHSHKSADLMSVTDIAGASTQPGLSTPIKWPSEPTLGLKSTYIPIHVAQIDNQDANFLVALRRNEASGAMELVSLRKGLFLRLSDFVNEYDFADFKYEPNDHWRDVHRMLRTDEGYADLAPAKP
ncbi:hypothetical protein SAMN05216359_11830 [Roseateles sp. YR242]|uniref:hypothetical protein n=1 Tax=Roseateles sp. YR242 TaxID=1855305 RepID=UPI0008D5B474|nr:hypothetical protein [Roseateles sp. YR242]SEL81954.1 hypothetical protein SAMN05216359_11830 [Roseateles sp. YR242]